MKEFTSIFILIGIMVVFAATGCSHNGPYYKDGIYHAFSDDPNSPMYLSSETRKALSEAKQDAKHPIPACVWNGDCQKVKFANFQEVGKSTSLVK